MKITRAIAVAIMKYLLAHPEFYFPFLLMNQEYGKDNVGPGEESYFDEITRDDFENCIEDTEYKTRELREDVQGNDLGTIPLLAQGYFQLMWISPGIKALKKELRVAKYQYNEAINDIDFIGEWKSGTEYETFERGYYRGIERAIDILSGKVKV